MMKATTLITLGALIGTCTFAAAQEQPQPQRPERGQRQVSPEMLKKFDKDSDGKLSDDERKAMREANQAEMLKKYDKDGDGKLNDEEKKVRDDEMAAKMKALTEKYDANKDGKLDREEFRAAREAGEEIPMGGGRGPGGQGGRRGPGAPEGGAPPAAPGQ
jgi:Ca2+-binding EF-hand superfamily protein